MNKKILNYPINPINLYNYVVKYLGFRNKPYEYIKYFFKSFRSPN